MSVIRYPHYSVPKSVYIELAAAGLSGGKRSFRAHAARMLRGIEPPPRVLGEENIPRRGPGLITVNHYSRPGFWSPWFSAAVSASVPVDIHWSMADAWTYPGRRFGQVYRWLSHWMLTRVADVYGFTRMPPMPPAPDEVAQRAQAVRQLMRFARAHPEALIALAPEGGDQPGGILSLPPAGFGRLALALARLGMPFSPVGVYEEDGCLFARFGAPDRLEIAKAGDRDQADGLARCVVMQKIAGCLPERLRGEFEG